jgi:peptidoglycan hydrolase CwlO-like protein
MDFRKQKLQELKSIQQDLCSQLELIKQNIEQLEKEIDNQNCPILSRARSTFSKPEKPDLKRVKRY